MGSPSEGLPYRTAPGVWARTERLASLGAWREGAWLRAWLSLGPTSAVKTQEGPLTATVNIIVASGMQKSKRCSLCGFQVADEQK